MALKDAEKENDTEDIPVSGATCGKAHTLLFIRR